MRLNKPFLLSIFLIVSLILLNVIASGGKSCQSCSKLTFNHQFHLTEVGVECSACHAGAANSVRSEDSLYPDHAVCADCHDVEEKDECGMCHGDTDQIQASDGYHQNYEVFSHKRHLDNGQECNSCHEAVKTSEQLSCCDSAIPRMNDCLDCHRKEGQTLECADCHYGKHPMPGDQNFTEWRRTHGLEAAFSPEYFKHYFDEGYCEDCHQGLNLKGEVHQPGWLFLHSDEAMAGNDCFVCHEDRTECAECHRSMLPIPHPLGDPNFANSETGGQHRADAEAYLEACISCHEMGTANPTCERCH